MSLVMRTLWRALRAVFLILAAVVIAIEEWGWRPLSAWAARLGHWPPVARLEGHIRRASPRMALVVFLVPALLLFPIKVLALWLIHSGRTKLGLLIILAAKALGTALLGRLFVLTELQLMQFAWFARAMVWWRRTKRAVGAAVERSVLWRALRQARRRISLWLRRRWRSLR